MKLRIFSVTGIVSLLFMQFAPTVFAKTIEFDDVPQDSWYSIAVAHLAEGGYLDMTKKNFEPSRPATRAEFVKLLVESNGGILNKITKNTFSDIRSSDWFYSYFEEAAEEGWVRGDNNCVGKEICTARPHDVLTRAEAVTLLLQTYKDIGGTNVTFYFPDNPPGTWYYNNVNTAIQACLLEGDIESGRIRPTDIVLRSEMAMIFYRFETNLLAGGGHCEGIILHSSKYIDPTTIRISFGTAAPVDKNWLRNAEHYRLHIDDETTAITRGASVRIVEKTASYGDEIVELHLEKPLLPCERYQVVLDDILLVSGVIVSGGFTDDISTTCP